MCDLGQTHKQNFAVIAVPVSVLCPLAAQQQTHTPQVVDRLDILGVENDPILCLEQLSHTLAVFFFFFRSWPEIRSECQVNGCRENQFG